MKNFQRYSFIIATLSGVLAGSASAIENVSLKAPATYDWLKYNKDGTRDPASDENTTISQAAIDYGCFMRGVVCATGTKVAGTGTGPATATLYFP